MVTIIWILLHRLTYLAGQYEHLPSQFIEKTKQTSLKMTTELKAQQDLSVIVLTKWKL